MSRKVTVVDKTAPVITLNGEASIIWEAGSSFVDPGAIAVDAVEGDLSSVIVVSTDINVSVPGSYLLSYNVKDSSGNEASTLTRVVKVVDSAKPVITLIGEAGEVVEAGSVYVDAGASANDNIDGDISANIKVQSNVNTAELGDYSVSYNVLDESGNAAISINRSVTVRDSVAPQLTIVGKTEQTVEVGQLYVELGASAVDSFEGVLTSVVVTSGDVNESVPGVYSITYNVADSSGNNAIAVTRKITVEDKTAPKIALIGESLVKAEVGEEFLDQGAKAIDNVDGDISSNVKITGAVDSSVIGIYELNYTVSDAAGNQSITLQRIVMVGDTGFPTITLNDGSYLEVQAGAEFVDPGATAFDKVDGDLSSEIKVSGDVINANKLGIYSLAYNVTDSNGNSAFTVVRTIAVVDTTAPDINITGSDVVIVEKGGVYNELGATAIDNLDGDLTDSIELSGNVLTQKVGDYQIKYIAIDNRGNVNNNVGRLVRVVDTIDPIIELIGGNELQVEAGKSFLDPGAIVTDYGDGEMPSLLEVSGKVDINVLGEYILVYKAQDASGNNAERKTRKITVVDSLAPDILLTGGIEYLHEAGTEYTDPGYSALDLRDGDLTANVQVTGSVKGDATGIYYVNYAVSDEAGNISNIIRTVIVGDGTPPVISLFGSDEIEILRGSVYNDSGYQAIDNIDGDITENVLVTGSVDTSTPGAYNITYSVSDKSNNSAISKKRTVTVVADKVAPVLTINGQKELEIKAGGSYLELGASAIDNIDGDLSDSITISGTVNANQPGVYVLTYAVNDNDGNDVNAIRTITVTDSVPPVISILGDFAITIDLGEAWNDPGYSAIDLADGDLTANVKIEGEVNSSAYGTYELIYTVSDSSGNESDAITRVVTVGDFGVPKISLVGDKLINIEAGATYNEPGYEAIDKKDGDLTQIVRISGNVDTLVPGEYELSYDVVDADGNAANTAKRFVIVTDTTIPVISIVGASDLTIQAGSEYIEYGVSASDSLDGDITSLVIVSSNINTDLPGEYTVIYNVNDSSGNYATEIVRSIKVVDTVPPTLTLKGKSETDIEAGAVYSELGAVAYDVVDGNLSNQIKRSGAVNAGVPGIYEISYIVTDAAGNESEKLKRTITVIDTQAPTLTQFKNILVREETLLELTFESDDNGRTDSEISFALRNQPEGVSLNTDASKIYWTPTEEQGPGEYSFELVANDGTQESTSIINVIVEEVNIRPIANDGSVTTLEDNPVLVSISGSDIESESLEYEITTQPVNGAIVGSGSSFTYIPNEDFNGADYIGFVVNDGALDSAEAVVTIDVTAVNDLPVISKAVSLQGIEDEPIMINYSLLGDLTDANDIDGDVIVYNISKILSGELTVNGVKVDGIKLNKGQEAIWNPGLDVNGVQKPIFELSVLDQVSESDTAVIVYADIESVADNPIIIWSKPDDITYGINLNETQLSAEISSNIEGAFAYFPENGTKLNAGTNQEIKAIFTPDDIENYNIVEATRFITVKQAAPIISWQSPAPVESGTLLGGGAT